MSTLHYEDSQVVIHKIVVGPYDNNVFVVQCRETGDALLVDAANEHEQLLELCQSLGVRQIVETLISNPKTWAKTALFITWDEGTTDDGCCRLAAGGHIATIVAGAGALLLADRFGWRAAYFCMAALMTVGTVAAFFAPEPESDKTATHPPLSFVSTVIAPQGSGHEARADGAHDPDPDRIPPWAARFGIMRPAVGSD